MECRLTAVDLLQQHSFALIIYSFVVASFPGSPFTSMFIFFAGARGEPGKKATL